MTGRDHPRRRPLWVAPEPPTFEPADVADDQLVVEQVDELVDTRPYNPVLSSIRLDLLADELRDELRRQPAQPAEPIAGQLVGEEWPTIVAPSTTRPPVPAGVYAMPRHFTDDLTPAEPVDDVVDQGADHDSSSDSGGSHRQLDWASRHDERSRAFDVAGLLRRPVPLQDRLWERGPVLDQGSEGACVGFACAGSANVIEAAQVPGHTKPEHIDWLDDADALRLYEAAQELDDEPGSDYAGTSVLAGMKAGAAAGYWGRYLWAFGTRELAQALMQIGPVVIGIPWHAGMYETAADGVVEVSGDKVGGHSLALVGLVMQHAGRPGPWFVWQNSWGAGYGVGGLGYVHHKVLSRLLAVRGEAAIPLPVDETGVTAL